MLQQPAGKGKFVVSRLRYGGGWYVIEGLDGSGLACTLWCSAIMIRQVRAVFSRS